ncbi:Co-chaperone Hsc20 [Laetiporus sulphureus 93-53]|uniref:Co-chaperone Hsc20 n=1 Tax=Laetiporus sulphureus 93-53 TaxID=1314785 RepID=A0A165CFF8_9APHY|nr:Co-chaperone Hsc20 [Laetiporus sulphureus 93-53]KZT02713.1 Co-chaperone Hsc20 [Laetiporus sulphureus 93-53]
MFRRVLVAAPPRLASALPQRPLVRIHLPPATAARLSAHRFSTSSPPHPKCPQCSAPLPSPLPICPKCAYIAPIPQGMTYHEMLGLPYEPNPFIVNPAALKRRFLELQGIIHPDRWVGRSKEQQELAVVMSARINDALHRLSNPLRRVEYILEHEGFAGEDTDKLEDHTLLIDILEMRERIEGAESREEVEEVRAENAEQIKETIDEIRHLVEKKDWPAVKEAAVKLKYLQGIEQAAAAWPHPFTDHH